MKKITAIIPCFNEEENIQGAIDSVLWADEIIVVDSFSTDQTKSIALSNKQIKWLEHEYKNSASQKNWTIPQAKHEWIFLLDADERCTSELRMEIQEELKRDTKHSAFWIFRQNYFMGKKLNYIWGNDRVIRLFKKSACRYQDLHVHAEIETNGSVGQLQHKIDHDSFKNIDHYKEKLERYAQWSAKDYVKKTVKVGFFHMHLKPAFRFLKHYVFELGILDGKEGFIISSLMAGAVRRRYEIIREIQS